jgi:hypothetical protein
MPGIECRIALVQGLLDLRLDQSPHVPVGGIGDGTGGGVACKTCVDGSLAGSKSTGGGVP